MDNNKKFRTRVPAGNPITAEPR